MRFAPAGRRRDARICVGTIVMKLSIVVPVFDEQDNLQPLHARLAAVATDCADEHEIVFVNDGSRDDSLAVMKALAKRDPCVKYVSFSRNFGHEIASTAGLDAASGDAVVLIDADLQDPPELIPELLAKWRDGAAVVYARRRARAGESAFKRATSYLFYRILNALSDVEIPADTGDFRLMDRRVVAALCQCRENPRFVRGLVSWVGFRQEALYYDRDERHAGETKYNLAKLLNLSWEAVCAFSLVPLRLAMWLGSIITGLSVLLTLIVVYQKLTGRIDEPGYAMLACGIFFLGGVQLLTLGILAQYVGYVFRSTQQRPLYVVEERGGGGSDDG